MGRMAEWLLNKKIMDQRDNHATEMYQTLAPMSEHSSGRSRGFGYVTFVEAEDAKAALSAEHFLENRALEVKIATPNHWRDIGFVHAQDSVDNLMFETHELGGSDVVVDRATPKEDNFRPVSRMLPPPSPSGGYGAYNAYVTARYAALGAPTTYDYPSSVYGSTFRGESARRTGEKIFIGRLPEEASVEDLCLYFGRFARILDVYIPKIWSHRFGFVTFAEDGVADRVSRRSHEICGKQVAIDSATPVDDGGQAEAATAIWTTHLNQLTKAMVPCKLTAELGLWWHERKHGACGRMDGWRSGWWHGQRRWKHGWGIPSRTDYRYRPSRGVHQRGGFVLNLLLKTICTC
ncbi:putative RNA recognition motif domain, nucleotide-binding alpha-beta plait domain superfamily [Helianthus anomalus]